MDKKLNKRIETYLSKFKNHLRELILKQDLEQKVAATLVEAIYAYDRLEFTKDDVSKRKRIKNAIPGLNRCTAKRANGEQCTRKQKEGHCFCGTHVKGTPHGVICNDESNDQQTVKAEVFAEEINGIVFYVDKYNNVYKTEDILNNKQDPQIIATCDVKEDGTYSMPVMLTH